MSKWLMVIAMVGGIFVSSCGRKDSQATASTGERYKGEYYGNRPKHMHNVPDAYARHPYVGGGFGWERR